MFTLSPNDNPTKGRNSMNANKDRNFGGNRRVTQNIQKAEDYTKPSLERRANVAEDAEEKIFNPVEDAVKDVEDMNDDKQRKREASRRAETSTVGADNKYRRPGDGDDKTYSEADNRPDMDGREDEHRTPDPEKKHGDRNVWRIGQDRDKPADQNIGPKAVGPR